jgi:hypothetical protein
LSDLVFDPLGAGEAMQRSIEAGGAAFTVAWLDNSDDRDEVRAALVEDMTRHAGRNPKSALAVMLDVARRMSDRVEELDGLAEAFALIAIGAADPIVPSREEEVVDTQAYTEHGGGALAHTQEATPPPPRRPPATDLPSLAVELVELLAGGTVAAVPERLTWLSTFLAIGHERMGLDHFEELPPAQEQADAEDDARMRMLVEVELLHDGLATFFAGALRCLGLSGALTSTRLSQLVPTVAALQEIPPPRAGDAAGPLALSADHNRAVGVFSRTTEPADLPLRVDRGLV